MASKVSPSSFSQLEIELKDAGNKLSSSNADIQTVLEKLKKNLSKVQQAPSESMKNALHPVIEALVANKLVRHPDINVNISVSCCFCEILRICAPDPPYNDEQLKDIFETVVITFEKLSSASGGCYTEMAQVLEIFTAAKLHFLFLDLDSDAYRLIARLFKQFLTVADSNSSAIILTMEEIMTMIIEEIEEHGLELVGLVVTFLKNNNKIVSPVCWQLGEKVLMNFAARSKSRFPDMSIALYDYSRLVASICKTTSEYNIMEDKETTHRIETKCVEAVRSCRHEEKTDDSFDDPPKSVTEVKTNNGPLKEQVSSYEDGIVWIQGYKVKQSMAQILEAVFRKHGDIAANCIFKTTSVRSSILEGVCEVVRRIQTNEVLEKMEEIECRVLDAEAANIDVTWLRAHFRKRIEVLEKSSLLMETKRNTLSVKRAARMDLKEGYEALVAAQERVGKAEMLVSVLDLIEKSLLESKAKLDLWVQQPLL